MGPCDSPEALSLSYMDYKNPNQKLTYKDEEDNHQYATLYCSVCGHMKSVLMYCGDRLCPLCKKNNYLRLLKKYSPLIRRIPSHRLSQITLTHKNIKFLSRESVKKIHDDFSSLRRTEFFKSKVRGGLAVVECKHESDNTGWNIHIHILVDSYFIPQKELSKIWFEITGDSFIVDIRQEENSLRAIKHLLKYFSKVPVVRGERVSFLKSSYNEAFYSSRNVISFGSLYSVPSNSSSLSFFALSCPKCGANAWITPYEMFRYRKNATELKGSIRGDP